MNSMFQKSTNKIKQKNQVNTIIKSSNYKIVNYNLNQSQNHTLYILIRTTSKVQHL
jgi:hypothetical protein